MSPRQSVHNKTNMVLFLLLLIGTATGFDIRCPVQAEWRLRASFCCSSAYKYVCLFNLLEQTYKDECSGLSKSSKGNKLVLQPVFNIARCNTKRYQPIVFTTNGNSECIFLKSKCAEEGQVVYSNGSSSNDITCRCDYTKGYAFVSQPKNSCFCIPSKEDCTCLRVECTKLSPDYQCISKGSVMENTKCPEIYPHISFNQKNETEQNNELIIKGYSRTHTITYFIGTFLLVLGVVQVFKVTLSGYNMYKERKPLNLELHDGIGQPKREIYDDDERQKCIHELFVRGECGKFHFIRLAFIGKNGVGKTSLKNRLLWQNKDDVTFTQSTDGIEINKCNINIVDGKWSPCQNINDDLTRLVHQVCRVKTTEKAEVDIDVHKDKVSFILDDTISESDRELSKISDDIDMCNENTSSHYSDSEVTVDIDISRANITECLTENYDNCDTTENALYHKQINSNTDENHSEHVHDKNINLMTSTIMKQCLQSSQNNDDDILATCWLWDFPGQKDFYATHQVFVSTCAVYLLVTDSLEFSTAGRQGIDFEDSAQYVSFWFDAIHCYCLTTKKGRLDPPIIVVCTNQDKVKEPIEQEKRQKIFKENLGQILHNQEKKGHLRNIFFVSNIEDNDIVFEEIRKEISRHAMELENWGKDCPLKWLLFQQVLLKLKDSNVPILLTSTLLKIAKHDDIGMSDKIEVERCLQYCHDIGTVVYFDEEILADYVILDPEWLFNAFQCLVSDKIDNVIEVSDDWQTLKDTGQLTNSLITHLFGKEPKLKFEDNKAHILEVMKRFDIIVNLNNSSALYMPCMIKSCSFSEVQNYFFDGSQSFYKTSWLCLEFKFLPPAFFNHIIAWYLKQYNVSIILDKENRSKRNALYRQIGVFDLDLSACEQLVVCEGPNVIALQVWDTRLSHKTYGGLRSNLFRFVETLQKRYSIQVSCTIGFQCKDGDFVINHKQIEDLIPEEYRCLEHNIIHLSEDLVQPWDFCEELKQLRKRKSQQFKRHMRSETDAFEDIR